MREGREGEQGETSRGRKGSFDLSQAGEGRAAEKRGEGGVERRVITCSFKTGCLEQWANTRRHVVLHVTRILVGLVLGTRDIERFTLRV